MELRHEIACDRGPIFRTGWSFNGEVLASAHFTGSVMFWNHLTGSLMGEHREHEMTVRCLAWSPIDFRIASGDTDGTLVIWDYAQDKLIKRIPKAHTSRIRSVAWSPDGQNLVSGSSDGNVRTWNSQSGKLLNESNNLFPRGPKYGRPTIYSVKWSPDGKMLASCHGNRSIIWSAENYEKIDQLEGHNDRVRSVVWSANGSLFASCSNDATIRVWDSNTWKEISVLAIEDQDIPPDTSIFCVHFSTSGKFIATKSTDNSVRIWRLSDKKCVVKLEELCGNGYGENLGGLSFHPHEPLLVTLRNNCKNLRVWELDYNRLEERRSTIEIDQGFKSSISRTIEFPPEYEQAGIAILNYFGKIVRDKYPDKEVSVQIRQEKQNVTLIIETGEKDREALEKELDDYGKAISGKLEIEDYLDEKTSQIISLKAQLGYWEVLINTQKSIIAAQGENIQNLMILLSQAIQSNNSSPSIPVSIEVNPTFEVRAQQNVEMNFSFSQNVAKILNLLSELTHLQPSEETMRTEITKIQDSLKRIQSQQKEEIKKEPGISLLNRFIGWFSQSAEKMMGHAKSTRDYVKVSKDLISYYNQIALWLGWPEIPSPF